MNIWTILREIDLCKNIQKVLFEIIENGQVITYNFHIRNFSRKSVTVLNFGRLFCYPVYVKNETSEQMLTKS